MIFLLFSMRIGMLILQALDQQKAGFPMKKVLVLMLLAAASWLPAAASGIDTLSPLPSSIVIEGVAQNPEGIEYDRNAHAFLLSSLNAGPVIRVGADGSWRPFTSGEPFPLSTAGLHIDYPRNRLLVAGFDGLALMDKNPETRGVAYLRTYDLSSGRLKQEVELSSLAPGADAYFANDVAVDGEGNVYVSDWYAGLIYKVDVSAKASVFWRNDRGLAGGPNGLDVHPDGYLLASMLAVNDRGIYSAHALMRIPLRSPAQAEVVDIRDPRFAGFDGMVVTAGGNVVGITSDGKTGGGNRMIELAGENGWRSARVLQSAAIAPSTTVAVTPDGHYYVINQDFADGNRKTWKIEKIEFR